MRPTVIVLCSAVLLVSGCAQQATRSPAPATTPTTRPVALDGCVQPSSAQLIDLGGGNQAAVLGTGRLGVVLSNQSDQNLCGWLPFAKTLATRGFRALVYDYDTAADRMGTWSRPPPSCASWGASQGAKGLIDGCAGDQPTTGRRVVSLSAERTAQGQDALPFVARLIAPVLFITAKGDRDGAAEATPQLYAAATKASSRRLEVVAGDAHGTDLLTGPSGAKVRSMVIGFLSKQAHSP